MKTFEMCTMLMGIMATKTAEVVAYGSWGSEFSVKQIRDTPERVRGYTWFKPVNPSLLTREQLEILGFRVWSAESGVMLIPLWLFEYLEEGIEVISISGESFEFCRAHEDKDHRGGVLAFGVYAATEKEI